MIIYCPVEFSGMYAVQSGLFFNDPRPRPPLHMCGCGYKLSAGQISPSAVKGVLGQSAIVYPLTGGYPFLGVIVPIFGVLKVSNLLTGRLSSRRGLLDFVSCRHCYRILSSTQTGVLPDP